MRFQKMLDEATIREIANELVAFQDWITLAVKDRAINPGKAEDILLDAFKDLEQAIKKSLKVR